MEYCVQKVFNNNVVLVDNGEEEIIFYGKGIGFGKKPGCVIVKDSKIEKVFTVDNKQFNQVISQTNSKLVGLCEDVIYMISKSIPEELDPKIHVSLIDHISFLVSRIEKGEEISNPFLMETEILFREEYRVAGEAIEILRKGLELPIPDDEIGFIALHIQSARNGGSKATAMKFAFVINSVTKYLEKEIGAAMPQKSLEYMRFVTHLRFAMERIVEGGDIATLMKDEIKQHYAASYKMGKGVAKIMKNIFATENVSDDEICAITVHIERIKMIIDEMEKKEKSKIYRAQ